MGREQLWWLVFSEWWVFYFAEKPLLPWMQDIFKTGLLVVRELFKSHQPFNLIHGIFRAECATNADVSQNSEVFHVIMTIQRQFHQNHRKIMLWQPLIMRQKNERHWKNFSQWPSLFWIQMTEYLHNSFWPPDKLLGTVKQWFVEDRRQGRARFHRARWGEVTWF